MSDISQCVIEAKSLLGEIETLSACPTNANKAKLQSAWNKLIDQARLMGIEIDRIPND